MEEKLPPKNFSLKDLPGASKLDVVARALLAIFPHYSSFLHPILHVLFTKEDAHLLTVAALPRRQEPYDEIEIAALIKDIINGNTLSEQFLLTWERKNSVQDYLISLVTQYEKLIYLHEHGKPFLTMEKEMLSNKSFCFFLGGRKDISIEYEELIASLGAISISLGTRSYLASTCIISVLYEIELMYNRKTNNLLPY